MSLETRRMRRAFWLACALLAGAVALIGCRAHDMDNANRAAGNTNGSNAAANSAAAADSHAHGPGDSHGQPSDGVRRITPAELQAALARGEAVVVDVRNQEMYDRGHTQGARLIPSSDIGARAGELPREKLIVTYCS